VHFGPAGCNVLTNAPKELNLGCVSVHTEQVFLSNFDGDRTYYELRYKVTNNIRLSDDDIMRFIILPLMGTPDKQKRIEEAVDLAKLVQDEKIQTFLIAGILTASDKFIDRDWLKCPPGLSWLRQGHRFIRKSFVLFVRMEDSR